MPVIDRNSDEEAANATSVSTIRPLTATVDPNRQVSPDSDEDAAISQDERATSPERSDFHRRTKFTAHRPSIASMILSDEDDETLPSATREVETETVQSVPLLGVQAPYNSLRIKKSFDNNSVNQAQLKNNSTRRKRGRLAAASRADIFAAKVASAVDEAKSSDSDETFVYDTNNSIRRPYNLRTTSSLSLPVSPHPKKAPLYVQTVHPTSSGPPTNAHASPLSRNHRASTVSPLSVRPHNRSQSGDRVPPIYEMMNKNDSIRAKHVYLQRWRGGNVEDEDDDNADGPLPDENTPLQIPPSLMRSHHNAGPTPHDYGVDREKAPLYVRVTLWVLGILMCLLFSSFVFGLIVFSSRPLVGVQISRLNDVFPSDKELVLNLIVQAKNPGCFAVGITDVDLDLFATSSYIHTVHGDFTETKLTKTVLLGNIQELESELSYEGGLFNPKSQLSMSIIRLVGPCQNNTELWQNVTSHPFELTVRGVLKYSVLFHPMVRTAVSSSVIVVPDETLAGEGQSII